MMSFNNLLKIVIYCVVSLTSISGQGVTSGVIWKLPHNVALFTGYLWRNSDIVFVEPDLRAETVTGVSKSGKICGFTMTSGDDKDMFFVSQVGQGWAEVRRKVSLMRDRRNQDSKSTTEQFYSVYLEAYDCDELRHYSPKTALNIISLNEDTIEMDTNEYKWSIRRDIDIRSVIGVLRVLNSQSKSLKYSYRILEPQFTNQMKVLENGNIVTMKSFRSNIPTVLSFRVLVTELDSSREVLRKAVAQVTITLLPVCQPKLKGIPDELEYYQDLMNPLETLVRNEIIQADSNLELDMCDYGYEQIETVDLNVRIKHSADKSNKTSCHLPSPMDSMRNEFCSGFKNELKMYLNNKPEQDSSKDDASLLNHDIVEVNNEFSILWWMKMSKFIQYNVMCLSDIKTGFPLLFVTMGPEDCTITVSISTQPAKNQSDLFKYYKLYLTNQNCHKLNEWNHFVVLKENNKLSLVNNGEPVANIQLDDGLKTIRKTRVSVGRNCVHTTTPVDKNIDSEVKLDSITLNTNKAISLAQIQCLIQCQNSLVLLNEKKVDQKYISQHGQVLKFSNIRHDTLQSLLSRISFMRLNIEEQNTKLTKDSGYSDIEIDLSINFKSKSLSASKEFKVKLPTNLIRINYQTASITLNSQSSVLSPPTEKSSADDRLLTDKYEDDSYDDVEIILKNNGRIVLDNRRNFQEPIKLLEDIKIENSDQPSSIFQIESCSVIPLERQLHPGERIYLDIIAKERVSEWKLKEINNSRTEWKLENPNLIDTDKYIEILSHLNLVTADEKRRFSIVCLLRNDEYTTEASIEVIQKPMYIIDDAPINQHMAHKSMRGGISADDLLEYHDGLGNNKYRRVTKDKLKTPSDLYSIAKPRFIAVIIMAVVGGAAWSLITAAVTCYLLRQRQNHNLHRRAAKATKSLLTPSVNNQLIDSLHIDNRLPQSVIAGGNMDILSQTTSFTVHPPNSLATSMSNVSSLVLGKSNSHNIKDSSNKRICIEDISEYPPTFYDHHDESPQLLRNGFDSENDVGQCRICDHDNNHIMMNSEDDEENQIEHVCSNLTRSNTINLPIANKDHE